MQGTRLPERIKNFIFLYVDSVELLEVLLLFHAHPDRKWSAKSLAAELRSNSNSTSQRILFLKSLQLVIEDPEGSSEYVYRVSDSEMNETINLLAETYPQHRRSIFELIFSPLKRARDLANAFRKQVPKEPEET